MPTPDEVHSAFIILMRAFPQMDVYVARTVTHSMLREAEIVRGDRKIQHHEMRADTGKVKDGKQIL